MTSTPMTERKIALVNAAGWALGARRAQRKERLHGRSLRRERHSESALGWTMAVVNLLLAVRYAA